MITLIVMDKLDIYTAYPYLVVLVVGLVAFELTQFISKPGF